MTTSRRTHHLTRLGVKRLRDLEGRRVRLVRDIETRGGTHLPEGTITVVDGAWRGRLMLTTVEKPLRSIRHVPLWDVERVS